MRSLEARYKNIADRNPDWSSYACFAEAIKGQGFETQTVRRWFSKIVEKDDYERNDKKKILLQLERLTKTPEDNQK